MTTRIWAWAHIALVLTMAGGLAILVHRLISTVEAAMSNLPLGG